MEENSSNVNNNDGNDGLEDNVGVNLNENNCDKQIEIKIKKETDCEANREADVKTSETASLHDKDICEGNEDEDADETESDDQSESEDTELEEVDDHDEDLSQSDSSSCIDLSDTESDSQLDEEDASHLTESSLVTYDVPPKSPSRPVCYICLNVFDGQEIGSPDVCDAQNHYFCLECIDEWAKRVNTCPVDRKSFTMILVRRSIDGNVIQKLPITPSDGSNSPQYDLNLIASDVTFCEICGQCDREDRLLLCDGCDFGYHCECLSPPLENIPIEEWYCPDCEPSHLSTAHAILHQRRRAIARTTAFEVVRERIAERRSGRMAERDLNMIAREEAIERAIEEAIGRTERAINNSVMGTSNGHTSSSSSNSRLSATQKTIIERMKRKMKAKPRKKPTRRRKTTRRKTTRRKKTVKGKSCSSKTPVRRRRKRKTRRRKSSKRRSNKSLRSSKPLPPPTTRLRIASKLGLGPAPVSPFGLPTMKASFGSNSECVSSNKRFGSSLVTTSTSGRLSLFGTELDTYDPRILNENEDIIENSEGEVGMMARVRLNLRRDNFSKGQLMPLTSSSLNSTSNSLTSSDILSQILTSQEILHSPSTCVTIGRDGTLKKCRQSDGNISQIKSKATKSGSVSPINSSTKSADPSLSIPSQNGINSVKHHNLSSIFNSNGNKFPLKLTPIIPPINSPLELPVFNNSSLITNESKGEELVDGEGGGLDGDKDDVYSDIESVNENQAIDEDNNRVNEQAICDSNHDSQIPNSSSISNEGNNKDDQSESTSNAMQIDVELTSPSKKKSIKELFSGEMNENEENNEDNEIDLRDVISMTQATPNRFRAPGMKMQMKIVLKKDKERDQAEADEKEMRKIEREKREKEEEILRLKRANERKEKLKDRWVEKSVKDRHGQKISSDVNSEKSKSVRDETKSIRDEKSSTETKKIDERKESEIRRKGREHDKERRTEMKPDKIVDDLVIETIDTLDDFQLVKESVLVSDPVVSQVEAIETKKIESEKQNKDESLAPIDAKTVIKTSEEPCSKTHDANSNCKIRRCRHGRVLKKDRHSSSHRHKDKSDDGRVKIIETPENPQTAGIMIESNKDYLSSTTSRELEQTGKPSHRMRSYRAQDGKPKDEELMFREREMKNLKQIGVDKLKEKRENREREKKRTRRKEKESERIRDNIKRLDERRKGTGNDVRIEEKVDMSKKEDEEEIRRRRRKHSSSRESSEKHDKKHSKHSHVSSSHAKHCHKHSVVSENERSIAKEVKRCRHSRRHDSHSHKKMSKLDDDKLDDDVSDVSSVLLGCSSHNKQHRSVLQTSHMNYPSRDSVIPLDSKEIYTEGDRIVINVNFNKKESKTKIDDLDEKSIEQSRAVKKDKSNKEASFGPRTPNAIGEQEQEKLVEDQPTPTQDEINFPQSPIISETLNIESNTNVSERDSTQATSYTQLQSPDTIDSPQPQDSIDFNVPKNSGDIYRNNTQTNDVYDPEAPLTSPTDPASPEASPILESPISNMRVISDPNVNANKPTQSVKPINSPTRTLATTEYDKHVKASGLTINAPSVPTHKSQGNSESHQSFETASNGHSNSSSRTSRSSYSSHSNSSSHKSSHSHYHSSSSQSQRSSSSHRKRDHDIENPIRRHEDNRVSDRTTRFTSPNSHYKQNTSTNSSRKSSSFQSKSSSDDKRKISPPTSQQKVDIASPSPSQLMPPPLPPPIVLRNSSAISVASAIASLNSNNLAQLLQVAQSINSLKNNDKACENISASMQQLQMQQQLKQMQMQIQAHNHNQQARQKMSGKVAHTDVNINRDVTDVVDMEVSSPSPPHISSTSQTRDHTNTNLVTSTTPSPSSSAPLSSAQSIWDTLIRSTSGTNPTTKPEKDNTNASSLTKRIAGLTGITSLPPSRQELLHQQKKMRTNSRDAHHALSKNRPKAVPSSSGVGHAAANKTGEQDDVPSSAVEMQYKEKLLKKLNRQERVVEEVKLVLKPYYKSRQLSKEDYKEILRKSVPKVCHSKTGEINPSKIKQLVEGYVRKYIHNAKSGHSRHGKSNKRKAMPTRNIFK